MVKALNLSGNINFDFKYDREGRAQLIEINPRLSATITAYAPAGVNLPYWGLKRLLSEPVPVCAIWEGVSMQRRNAEVFFAPDGSEIEW